MFHVIILIYKIFTVNYNLYNWPIKSLGVVHMIWLPNIGDELS